MSLEEGAGSHLSIKATDGNTTASPINKHSPAFKDGILSTKSPKVSGNSFLTYDWSLGLVSLMAIKLLHCEKMVSDISEGRWLANNSETPYLRPSLAIRSIDSRDAYISTGRYWAHTCEPLRTQEAKEHRCLLSHRGSLMNDNAYSSNRIRIEFLKLETP